MSSSRSPSSNDGGRFTDASAQSSHSARRKASSNWNQFFKGSIHLPDFGDTGHNSQNDYKLWKNLVMTYRNTGCPTDLLLLQALCSLKGSVSEVALGLGDQLTLDKLLQGLENPFGMTHCTSTCTTSTRGLWKKLHSLPPECAARHLQ